MIESLLKLFHIHIFHHHHFAGVNHYLQCRCGERIVKTLFKSVYTPIDQEWLNGNDPDIDIDQIFRTPPPKNK